jgi:hypothetical protein
MRQVLLFFLVLNLYSGTAFPAKGGKSGGWAPSPTNSVTGGASGHGGSVNSRTQIFDPRAAPPLAPTRKVTPVDCSKPIVLDGGNLQCR